jgi:hypothetical protein
MQLLSGLKNRSPMAPSETPKGGSVNDAPTRSGAAPTPRTLGPRTA